MSKGNGYVNPSGPITRADLITIPLVDILAQVDAAGDGLDKEEQQVVETLKAMDLNGDNEISIKELVQMGNVIRKGKEESARLKKIITVISVLSFFFLGLFLCIVVAGVEATKESHTSKSDSPTLVDNEGKVIGTASAHNVGPLRSDLPFDTLAAMATLRLVSEPGNVTHFFKISGFERDPTGLLTLYTHQGLASTLYVKDDEVWMTGEKGSKIVLRKKGRRLLEDNSAVTALATTGVGGGCNGEAAAGTPCVQTALRANPALTVGRCACADEWEYAGQVFRGGQCGNPDGDAVGAWCLAEDDATGKYGGIAACRGNPLGDGLMWDYCTTKTHTRATCECEGSWSYRGQTFLGTCGTPDGDATPWCFFKGTCGGAAGGNWDYCDPPAQSVNAAESLVAPGNTPTAAAAPTCDADQCCEPSAPAIKAKWTFIVYGVSDNNLEAFMGYDLKEMAKAGFGTSEEVNMIVLADRGEKTATSKSYDDGPWLNQAPFTSMKTFYVSNDEITCLKDHGEGDMSKVGTFVNFTEWTVKNYPAEKYGVIYWNHGIGWHGFGGDQTPGIHFAHYGEKTFDAYMDLPGLERSLQESLDKTGLTKFDLVGFDACSMASAVVTAKIAKFADVLVFSEDTEPGHGWDYAVFKDVVATPTLGAMEVAKKLIGGMQGAYELHQHTPVTLTARYTAVDTSKWGAFQTKFYTLLDAFTAAVLKPEGTLYSCAQINGVQTFLEAVKGDGVTKLAYHMVDLGNLIAAMKKTVLAPESAVPAVAAMADEALAALGAMQPLPQAKSSDRAHATGLGALFPAAADVAMHGLAWYTEHYWYGPFANFSDHASVSYDTFLEETHKAGAGVAAALDTPAFTAAGLQFAIPNGMVSSFPFYRNGLRSVKVGCVVADATAGEKLALGCGDYSIDKWTNNPVSVDVALAYHTEDLKTIPTASCFYMRVFDAGDTTCPPAYMLKGESNSKALTGFTSYYGMTNAEDPDVVHVYGSLLPGGGKTPSIGPIQGSTTQGPILQTGKDKDSCNGKTMSSAPNFGARADWDGVSYHLRQRKYVSGTRDGNGDVVYGSSTLVVDEAPGYAESSYKTSKLGWKDGAGNIGDSTELITKVTKIMVAYYPEGNPTCTDKNSFCSQFAAHGECKNPQFDMSQCAKSCGVCTSTHYDGYVEVKEEPLIPAGCTVGGVSGYAYVCVRPASGRLDYATQKVVTALYAKLPGNGLSEVSRKKGTGFVPYVYTSSSKNPDDGNGTLAGGPSVWYKDFRLAHGKFFDWDPDSEVNLHRKLRAAELGISSGRAVLFGVAEDAANRKAVLSSWSPTAVAAAAGRRLLDGAASEATKAETEAARDEKLAAARDKMAERTVMTVMKMVTPQKVGQYMLTHSLKAPGFNH